MGARTPLSRRIRAKINCGAMRIRIFYQAFNARVGSAGRKAIIVYPLARVNERTGARRPVQNSKVLARKLQYTVTCFYASVVFLLGVGGRAIERLTTSEKI